MNVYQNVLHKTNAEIKLHWMKRLTFPQGYVQKSTIFEPVGVRYGAYLLKKKNDYNGRR